MSTAETAEAPLAPEEIRAVMALAAQYDEKRAASIEALKLVQRRHRWVSDRHLRELAALLDMTAAELDNVATFYNLVFRRPVGRHVIMLCDSVSCWLMGQEELLGHCRQCLGLSLGATTPDDRFTLLPTVCLGHCDHAPAMLIDGDLHGDLDPARLDIVLDEYR
jgi:NADH-quinone oxidoreductase subunit E